jgi:hypothetical protein
MRAPGAGCSGLAAGAGRRSETKCADGLSEDNVHGSLESVPVRENEANLRAFSFPTGVGNRWIARGASETQNERSSLTAEGAFGDRSC